MKISYSILIVILLAIPALAADSSRYILPTVTSPYPDGINLGTPTALRPKAKVEMQSDPAKLFQAGQLLQQGLDGAGATVQASDTGSGGLGSVRVKTENPEAATKEAAMIHEAVQLVQKERERQKDLLGQWGIADVTHPLFGADPTGKTDSTKAIQKAVDFARDNQLACYFPSGTYLVSDTIDCAQKLYMRSDNRVDGSYFFPCFLMGERTPGLPRPKIVLAPKSKGFTQIGTPKPVVDFWARGHVDEVGPEKRQSNINYNQILANIDITISEGNDGAYGINHTGAQGCSVQDSIIDATHGIWGMETGLGAGSSLSGVTIIGGDIGLYMPDTEAAPTISGVTLINQRRHAMVCNNRQALSAVGLRIQKEDPRAAIITGKAPHMAHRAQICLTDSSIEFTGKPGIAVNTNDSLYLLNCYVSNAAKVVKTDNGQPLDGLPGKWMRVREYALPIVPKPYKGIRYGAVVYVDGRPAIGLAADTTPGVAPPANLQSRHRWPEDIATWQTPGAANVKERYGAKGDGKADDTQALQKAIDENEVVFLPKGYYRVSKTIQLKKDTKLVGVGRCYSWIMATRDEGDFTSDEKMAPLVRTASGSDAVNQMSFMGIFVPRAQTMFHALEWNCGPKSILKDTYVHVAPLMGYARAKNPPLWTHAQMRITGAGKWYNFFHFGHRGLGRAYRYVLVDRGNGAQKRADATTVDGPLRFYQVNLEHSLSQSHMEVLNSDDVSIFGFKCEGNAAALMITDSTNVAMLGYGGNASAQKGKALFYVKDSSDYLLANLMEAPRINKGSVKSVYGKGFHPNEWHMLIEQGGRVSTFRMPHRDRPVLYRWGMPKQLKGDS